MVRYPGVFSVKMWQDFHDYCMTFHPRLVRTQRFKSFNSLNLQGEDPFAGCAGTPPLPGSSVDSSLGSWLHESGVPLEDFFRKQTNGTAQNKAIIDG